MIEKKPSKKEIKEVLARAEKIAKSEERIIDRSLSHKEKGPGKPKNMDELILEEIQGLKKEFKQYQGKTDKLEQAYNRSVTQEKTKGQGSETAGKTNEEILKEAEREQEEAVGGQQPGQTQAKPFYETAEYAKLSDKEKRLAWEEGARQQQTQQQLQGQQQAGLKLSNQQLLYGAIEVAKIFAPVAQTAIAKAGNSDNPLKSFLEQMKVYQNIENTVLGGFFNFMKNLSPQQRQNTMTNIISSPSTPTVGDLSSKSEIIK